jgi:cellulose synthase (UDP-forming)
MAKLKEFYFSKSEHLKPEAPLPYAPKIEFFWQMLAGMTIALGGWYLWWRWSFSLNSNAMWFSLPVVIAESCAFVGLLLYFHNLWSVNDTAPAPAPECRADVISGGGNTRISVDVFLPTYNEDPELTRYSIRDAKAMTYPYPIDIKIFVLDDGRRQEMKNVALQEGVNYITRSSNVGYKAGNLRNGMEQTVGDFLVILDSDTRPFPTLLQNTLGYFRDPCVAWVQTPQWFYDIPQGQPLEKVLQSVFGRFGAKAGLLTQKILGRIKVGHDPFISDPKLFYDVIQRRRNGANASFCCGAGSVHRREAVMEAALKAFADNVGAKVNEFCCHLANDETRRQIEDTLNCEMLHATELTPYKFHVSEDIYTSLVLLMDQERGWKSVYHPGVETKMLSPLDMQSWAMQRFKYAGGTLDIMFNDNPLFRKGLSLRQKLMFGMTFWSYLAPLWNVIFIAAPIIALFTGISPVEAYSSEFFLHLLPFLVVHELASIVGTWGINNRKGRMLNLAFFSFNLQAMWAVLTGKEIRFKVTPKQRKTDRFMWLVAPQIAVVVLTFAGIVYAGAGLLVNPDSKALGSFVVNGFWGLSNAWAMSVLIAAALWQPKDEASSEIDVKNRLAVREVA